MPNKRRYMSCQTCRRLKTRCEVVPGSQKCNRCTTLRLDCSLPSIQPVQTPSIISPVGQGGPELSNNNNNQTQPIKCACSSRLDAIEASLAEIKQLLLHSRNPQSQPLNEKLHSASARNTIRTNNEVSPSIVQSDEENTTTDSFPDDGLPEDGVLEESEQDVQVAPIKVVRHLYTLIHGSPTRDHNESIISELSKLGLTSGSLVDLLFEGFRSISSLCPFVICESPGELLKRHHYLLFAACLLAGIQVVDLANGPELHKLLYDCVKSHLGMQMLDTPLPVSTIQVLLIFSLYNLGPSYTSRYIDSWLVSSSAISHSMLSINLSELSNKSLFRDTESQETYRTWMLTSLAHLKFAIGTGQPPVIDVESLKPWITLKRNYDPCDRAIAAQLELYILLYGVVRKGVGSVSSTRDDLENWSVRNLQVEEEEYPGKYEATLQFTYLSVRLILARWEVAKLQAVPRQQHQGEEEVEEVKGKGTGEENEFSDSATRQQRISSVIELILRYSHLLLDKGMHLCSQTALVKPSYDFLISAYAGVTLVEYASFLPNPKFTFELMEKVQNQGHWGYNPKISLEPVFNWATNVMRKKAQDYSVSMQQAELDAIHSNFDTTTNESRLPISMDWIPNTLIDSVYVSDHGDWSIPPV